MYLESGQTGPVGRVPGLGRAHRSATGMGFCIVSARAPGFPEDPGRGPPRPSVDLPGVSGNPICLNSGALDPYVESRPKSAKTNICISTLLLVPINPQFCACARFQVPKYLGPGQTGPVGRGPGQKGPATSMVLGGFGARAPRAPEDPQSYPWTFPGPPETLYA